MTIALLLQCCLLTERYTMENSKLLAIFDLIMYINMDYRTDVLFTKDQLENLANSGLTYTQREF